MLIVNFVGCALSSAAFLESRCKDTAISRYHQISACDKARFSTRFQSETCYTYVTRSKLDFD